MESRPSDLRSITLDNDPAIWSQLSTLWENSSSRCPFQSPALLRYFSGSTDDIKRVFALYRDGEPIIAMVLKQDSSGNLTFLSDLKTDVNRVFFHTAAGAAEKAAFFGGLFNAIRSEGLSLTLNNLLGDDEDTALLKRVAEDAGLYTSMVLNSATPVVVAATPQELFKHVNGLRELRYRVNKLRKQPDTEFEIFTDDTALEDWTTEFCGTHVLRWSGTPTPSHLRHPHRRVFLLGCLTAWASQGLLVRFSIRVAGQRIGYVVGLRAPHTIIHHSTTYDPRHAKSSPGKALILHMAEWMAKNDYRTLDFGDGREDYKYTVATGDRPLVRLFISSKSDLRFIVSSQLVRLVRGNRFMYDVYQRHIKRRLQA